MWPQSADQVSFGPDVWCNSIPPFERVSPQPFLDSSRRMMPVVEQVCRSDFPSRWSILLTFADLMAVANAAFQRLLEFWNNQISIAQR